MNFETKEVRVDTYVENIQGTRRPINRAYFVMVSLDENDNPLPVPRLLIENGITHSNDARFVMQEN